MKILKQLSDQELLTSILDLRGKEHRVLIEVLKHLAEIDNRKIYRDAGYSSLFDYAIRKLLYTEDQAYKRITAARSIDKFPLVLKALEAKELNLSTVSLISSIINPDNINKVLEATQNKSKREVEEYVASFKPIKQKKESIKPVVVVKSATPLFQSKPQVKAPVVEEPKEQRFNLSFSINKETKEKLEEAKAILANKDSKKVSLEDLMEEMLEVYLDKKSPKRRQARRENSPVPGRVKNAITLSRRVKDQVLEKDKYQCSYVAPDGTRCNCKTNLQVDHIKPKALGGDNSISNLRVLCGAHNRLLAEEKLGKEFMQRFY